MSDNSSCARAKSTAHSWCVQALVRAIAAAGTPKVILRSDSELAITDLQ